MTHFNHCHSAWGWRIRVKWERIIEGLKDGEASSPSWNTMVTMSFPICLFLSTCTDWNNESYNHAFMKHFKRLLLLPETFFSPVWTNDGQNFNSEMSTCLCESDVTYVQVWQPILGICALHLTHPKCTHTAVGSHLFCGAQGAVGGSVACSRAPQSWYWGWRDCCTFTPPTDNSCWPETRNRNLSITSLSL